MFGENPVIFATRSGTPPLRTSASTLPPFRPIDPPHPGFAEVQTPLAIPRAATEPGLARLDAVLAQLDRIPDAPAPFQPLAWDEHGLPQ